MAVNEFMLVIGMIIVGLIFFMIAQGFIFGELKTTKENMYKAEAEGIVSLIQRTMSEQGNYFYYFREISLSNVSVKNGVLTYQKDDLKFLYTVPKEVGETDLSDVASVCVLKKNGNVELLDKCPKCNMDSMCSPDECKESCQDCYGPSSICIGDGYCNKAIGENCENSVDDCPCTSGICCPASPDSDKHGCSNVFGIGLGEECGCGSQCESGLDCNPTAPTFTAYRKACCVPGKGWDGSQCVEIKCPDQKMICPGASMGGEAGDHAWTDLDGNVCCPLSNIGDISGPVCSSSHCCPTHKPKWCSKPLSGEPRCMSETDYKDKTICKGAEGVFDVFIVPVIVRDSNAYKKSADEFIQNFMAKSPFKDCDDKWDRVKFWIAELTDCPDEAGASGGCGHCSSCISIGGKCARKMEGKFGVAYDKYIVLTTSGGWTGGCACSLSCPGSSSSVHDCNDNVCIPTHELGHQLGLCHVQGCGAGGACMSGCPNKNDCNEPDKVDFIMDYCAPMKKFGPQGYNFMKTQFIGSPPNSQGLEKWVRGC